MKIDWPQRVAIDAIDVVPLERLADGVARSIAEGARIMSLFARPVGDGEAELWAILLQGSGELEVLRSRVGSVYPSLTPRCPAAHLFERALYERDGLVPEGHPWLRPVRGWPALAAEGRAPLYRLDGDEVHEVAVGPVHAGVIEPGHFRFHCHGERVFNLEIAHGYQHRGIHRALVGGPGRRTLAQMETIAGDTTIGHAWAHAQVIEALADAPPPPRAEAIRAVALELERLANHVGDLGALAGDVGFLPTASYCGGLRGDLLNLTAALCGSRLGRGLVRPGGVRFDLDSAQAAAQRRALDAIEASVKRATALLWGSASVTGRFECTGTVSTDRAREIGMVGVAGRASGLDLDLRRDRPTAAYRAHPIGVCVEPDGDVYSRGRVREREVQQSLAFLRATLDDLPSGPTLRSEPLASLSPDSMAIGLTEGWRGELCHVAITDAQGRFSSYEVVDPSFHNWPGMEQALRGGEISDFPLCNKSFNLSYAGHDL